MAFDRQNITNQGFYLLKKVKDGCSLSFTAMFVEENTVQPSQMPNGGGLTYSQADSDKVRFSKGIMWSVTPIKSYINNSGNTEIRAVGKFNKESASELVVRTAYLFASVLDSHGAIVVEEGQPLENILFAVASNNEKSVLQSDGKNSLFVSFSVVLTNGFSSIISMENGLATLQDLENLQGGLNLQKLTLKFDENTKDLQLFDADGVLIDQANLGGSCGSDDAVTVHGAQYVFGQKIWADPTAVQRPCNTVYEIHEGGETQYVFVSGVDAVIEEMAKNDPAAMEAYVSRVKVFRIIAQDGKIALTQLSKTFSQAKDILLSKVLRKPRVTDFFVISDDRDPDTPENIGQDTVRALPVTTDLEAALMWIGYGQIIANDPSVEDAQNGRYALYPDTISVDGINSLIPVKAVDPKDFKSVYTHSECSALKLAYAEIGECEHNGVKLKDAERTNLFRTLKGIYEQQVSVARVAFGNAISSWNQTLYLESNMRMTSVSHEGILLGNEDQFFNIGMEKESSEKEEKQKIALSRKVYWSETIGDETVQFSENRPFAFIGDSGMLGGAPLFTVRIIAAAHYTRGTKNWLLNSVQCSDGFKAELCGQLYNNVHNPSTNQSHNAHLYISCADNLKLNPFTSVVIEVDGYTGVNGSPVNQHKHLGCVVPFDVSQKHNPEQNMFGCDIDMTIPLNSWVQSDAAMTPLCPDMITVKGYICDIKDMGLPEISTEEDREVVFEDALFDGITVAVTRMFGKVYMSGKTEAVIGEDLPKDTRVLVNGISTLKVAGYRWYRIYAVNANGEHIDAEGNVTASPIYAYVLSSNVIPYEEHIDFVPFVHYARIPAGVQRYDLNDESDKHKYREPLADKMDVQIAIRTDNGWYGIEDPMSDSGYFFVKENGDGVVLDCLTEFAHGRPEDTFRNIPSVFVSRLYNDGFKAVFSGDSSRMFTPEELGFPVDRGTTLRGLIISDCGYDETVPDDYLSSKDFMVFRPDDWASQDKYLIVRDSCVSISLQKEPEELNDLKDSLHRVNPFEIHPINNSGVEPEYVIYREGEDPTTDQSGLWGAIEDKDITKYFESADKEYIGLGFVGNDDVVTVIVLKRDGVTVTPDVLTPFDDTTVSDLTVLRYATGTSTINKYAQPKETAEVIGTLDMTQDGIYITLDGKSNNGFYRVKSTPVYYVRESDITLNVPNHEVSQADRYSVTASESLPVTYYLAYMPDGTLVNATTVTEGTFDGFFIRFGNAIMATYRRNEESEPITCFIKPVTVTLDVEQRSNLITVTQAVMDESSNDEYPLVSMEGYFSVQNDTEALNVNTSNIVVVERNTVCSAIGIVDED